MYPESACKCISAPAWPGLASTRTAEPSAGAVVTHRVLDRDTSEPKRIREDGLIRNGTERLGSHILFILFGSRSFQRSAELHTVT
jgi:hypothetical protein